MKVVTSTVAVPLLALAFAGFVYAHRDRPLPFARLGGMMFLAIVVPVLVAGCLTEMPQTVEAYHLKMEDVERVARPGKVLKAWYWSCDVVGMLSSMVDPRNSRLRLIPRLGSRLCGLAIVALVVWCFVHYFPVLEGLLVRNEVSKSIVQTLPWTNL